ncbi:hypothetical protein [Rhodobacter capsulatus]|uniref:hypothetical protein n=1 Tax=Rhodobacter capsulatus TaxID=1061 RepID=UPI004026A115
MPTLAPGWLLAALAGIGILRALRRHAKALAQIIAAPPTPRLSGVALLGACLVALFAIQLLDLLSLGRVLIGPLGPVPVRADPGTALHGLTLKMHWPDWADAVIAATEVPAAPPSYARSGLDPEAMAQLLTRIDAAMRRDGLWRAPGLAGRSGRGRPGEALLRQSGAQSGAGRKLYDYVNGWRVSEAQALLRATDHTVLDIAHATGSNAKSTFNAASQAHGHDAQCLAGVRPHRPGRKGRARLRDPGKTPEAFMTRRSFLVLLGVLPLMACLRPQDPRFRPYPHRSLHIAGPAGVLAGDCAARRPGPFPAVLLLAGSGPQDRDEHVAGHRPFLVLSDALARAGIASLRYDKRGVAAP